MIHDPRIDPVCTTRSILPAYAVVLCLLLGSILSACGGTRADDNDDAAPAALSHEPADDTAINADDVKGQETVEALGDSPVEHRTAAWIDSAILDHDGSSLPPDSVPHSSLDEQGRLIAEGFMCDKKPVGMWIYYGPDGRTQMVGTYVYGGRRHGSWTTWHDNGSLAMRGTYLFGEEHGRFSYYHDNGKLAMQGDYQRGARIGEWRSWHQNGRRSSHGHFVNDREAGTWRHWASDGRFSGRVNHDDRMPLR